MMDYQIADQLLAQSLWLVTRQGRPTAFACILLARCAGIPGCRHKYLLLDFVRTFASQQTLAVLLCGRSLAWPLCLQERQWAVGERSGRRASPSVPHPPTHSGCPILYRLLGHRPPHWELPSLASSCSACQALKLHFILETGWRGGEMPHHEEGLGGRHRSCLPEWPLGLAGTLTAAPPAMLVCI